MSALQRSAQELRETMARVDERLELGDARDAVPASVPEAPASPTEAKMEALIGELTDAAGLALKMANRIATPSLRHGEIGAAVKLTHAAAALAQSLARCRGLGSTQVVRVERVVVEDGGQAVVGAVARGAGGGGEDGR